MCAWKKSKDSIHPLVMEAPYQIAALAHLAAIVLHPGGRVIDEVIRANGHHLAWTHESQNRASTFALVCM